MMGSILGSKDTSENGFKKCQLLPSAPYRQKFLKRKPSFKSPVSCKRLKLANTITNSSKCGENLNEHNIEEKETILRRSKRKKNCNTDIQMEEIVQKDIQQNDVKETKYDNIHQNFYFNLIPENVTKSLDKELFPDEGQNLKCTEDISNKTQTIISINKTDPYITCNNDDNKLQQSTMSNGESAIKKIECNTQCLPNSSQISNEIDEDNKDNDTEIMTQEEKIEVDCTIILDTLEHKNKRNNNTKCEITEIVSTDSNVDVLYVDIKQKDDTVNSLVNVTSTEKICSENKDMYNSISNQTTTLSESDSVNTIFCTEQDKNASNINLVENYSTFCENLSETKALTSSKNCDALIDEQQKNSLVTKHYVKNKQSEEHSEISDVCNNPTIKEENIEEEHNSSDGKDLNYIQNLKLDVENKNKDTKKVNDLSNLSNNSSSSKNEKNIFLTENSNSINLQSTKALIQNSSNVINNSGDIEEKIKITTKCLEIKRKNLTLLYMSALDYEKGNQEDIVNRTEKDNEVKDKFFHPDNEDECANNHALTTEKNEQMTKVNLNEFSRDIDEQNIKIISEQQIYQSKQENTILNKKKELKEDISQNCIETKTNTDDFEIQNANKVKYDTIISEHRLKNHDLMKNDLACYNEIDKQHDIHKKFTTLQFNENNVALAQTQKNFSTNDNILSDKKNSENDKTEKLNKRKCISKEDITITVTTEYFNLEKNEKIKEVISDKEYENMNNVKEDKILNEDVEENFDFDDDFGLTSSQINMLEINEKDQYKLSNEVKPDTSTENCSSTHFGQDSLTVEIMNQLCYIKETVHSIKDMLKTFIMENKERK